jgi:hypothetical protein
MEEEAEAGGGDEVPGPGNGDGVGFFDDGPEGDWKAAPQRRRENREHKAQGRTH